MKLRRLKRFIRKYVLGYRLASDGYTVIKGTSVDPPRFSGWDQESVAQTQHEAFQPLIALMRQGQARIDFEVLAQAIQQTGLRQPSLVEIGCGSGYYSEILTYLLKEQVDYTGLDFSFSMVSLARHHYPTATFLQGDATILPFASQSFDIAINGTALMHILDYKAAIAECRRVARFWCIFHTVPVLQHRATSILRKQAYGAPVVEIILNEQELLNLFSENGLEVQSTRQSIDYNLIDVLKEATVTKTYLCRVKGHQL